MKARISTLAALIAVFPLAGCEGLRDALTAHTETVARAGNQELTATQLADVVGNSQAPVRRDVVRSIADIWVNYQLLGVAAARGDSLNDPALVDSAMWSLIAGTKGRQYYDRIARDWGEVDTAGAPAAYARGDLLAASHILLLTQNQPDSVRVAKLAQIRGIRARATGANFAELASQHSEDRGSAERGGRLGVFPRGAMVPEFETALRALDPGEISDVVETQYGFHLIRRPVFAEVREDFLAGAHRLSMSRAESLYTARLDSTARVTLRRNAASRARTAALDFDAHRGDRAVLATSSAGPFTTARFVQWLETFPPQQQIPQRLQQAPDSAVEGLIRNFVRNELMVKAADSVGIRLSAEELDQIRGSFASQVQGAWLQLGVNPRLVADSGAMPAAREAFAARRVNNYLRAMLADELPFLPIIPQLQWALRSRYEARVNSAGIDRAVQLATRVRARADSGRAAQPGSVLPLPPPGGAQPPAATPPATPPTSQ